jgi:RHS repeat-associated protein
MMISHPKFRKFLAHLSVVLLLVGSPNVLLGFTSEGYQQAAISGRSSIAIVTGPGGTKINTYNGNLFLPRADLRVPGRSIPLEFELTYNANQSGFSGPFGFGWRSNYDVKCLFSGLNVVVQWADGRNDLFVYQDGLYTPANEGVTATLQQVGTSLQLASKEQIKFFFDGSSGLLQQIQDPNGNAVTLSYTGTLLTVVTDAGGRSLSLAYDANGRVTTITDGNASPPRTLGYAYDGLGNQVSFTDALGHVTTYAYDATHHLTTVTDPLGVTRITYGAPNMAAVGVSRSDPAGALISSQTLAYDTTNLITTVTDQIGVGAQATTSYQYDANRRLSGVTNPLGHAEIRTYDSNGNLSSVTNGAGETTAYTYDGKGNKLTETDPLGHTTSWTYHPVFNFITSVTDGNGATISFNYDANGNLISRVDGTGNVTQYTYDAFGQRVSRRNARGFTTTFTYDANGNRTSVTDPLGRTQTIQYDGAGRMTLATDGNGKTRAFSYDAADRLTKVTFADGTTATFDYNVLGKLVRAVDPNTDLALSYNAAGWLLQVVDQRFSKTISYAYDGVGNRIQMTGPTGAVTQNVYDLANRLVGARRGGQEFGFSYDQANRLTGASMPNGASSALSYDAAGRLLSVLHRRSDGGVISSYSYQYDNGGRRTRLTLANGDQVNYSYDGSDRLTAETRTGGDAYDHRFTYDPVGNPVQLNADGVLTSYTYDPADQLTLESTGAATATYAYDGNGNRTSKAIGGNTLTYAYDDLSRLIKYSESATGATSFYTYDAFGRRATKTAGGATTRFVYDNADSVAEYDGAGTLLAENWYGIGADNNIARIAGGNNLYYLRDGLNSVRQLIDDGGSVRNSYDYDAWGNLRSSVESVANRVTYTGREWDSESGLYYYRARSYDAGTGRFVQQDPVDDDSGRSPYAYVDNNPTNAIDPSGAVWFWVAAAIAVGWVLFGPEGFGGPGRLNRGEDLMLENDRLRRENQRLQDENRRLREELERLRRQRQQQAPPKAPKGGNEQANAGIDGGYGSGTTRCVTIPSLIGTIGKCITIDTQ